MFEHFHNKMLGEAHVSVSNFLINCQPVPPWSEKQASAAPPTRDPAVEWHWPDTPSGPWWGWWLPSRAPGWVIGCQILWSYYWVQPGHQNDQEKKNEQRFIATTHGASQVVLVVKKIHLPMQEMWIRSLGREDPLEKEVATHSSIPAWRIPWTEEPYGL